MSGFLKGLGIFILLAVGYVIYEVTGPHSASAVLEKMQTTLKEAQRLESNGDIFFERATLSVGSSDPDRCKFNFKAASIAYKDAYDQYILFQSYSDKMGRWDKSVPLDTTKMLQPKITKLESRFRVVSADKSYVCGS